MKQTLSDQDRKRLNKMVTDVEKGTHTQIVLALIQQSDSYSEIPWKAFAWGASMTGLGIFIADLFLIGWYTWMSVSIAAAAVLAGGAVLMVLTLLIPGFAKQFLSVTRSEMEVRQYAESLFLNRELFKTTKRTGILLMVSLFERKVIILPDKGLRETLSEDSIKRIIATMTSCLKQQQTRRAFEVGMEQLSQLLGDRSGGTSKNELSDEIIEEKGV